MKMMNPRRRGPHSLYQFAAVAFALILAGVLCGAIVLGSHVGSMNDLMHYKYWTRLISVEGMHAAYSGTFPKTYAIYPPVTLTTFRVAGALYQHTVDPSFDLDRALTSHQLNVLIRLQALLFHLVVGLAVLIVARQAASFAAAYAAMLAYLFNPGVVFDVSHWGQPDPVYGLFVLLALAAAAWGAAAPSGPAPQRARVAWLPSRAVSYIASAGSQMPPRMAALAGAAIVLAAFAKPQAWVYLPLIVAVVWRRGGMAGLVRAAAAGTVAATVVAVPYLLHGTVNELLGLQRAIRSVMPVVSANAHN